ncbi:MAG: hypothetical protein AAGD06_19400, partial [Acidobacteriota bacterium]
MSRPRGQSWPSLSLSGTSFILRLGLLLGLGWIAQFFSNEVALGAPRAPGQALLPYIVLGVVGTLLFGPELTSFLSRVGRWLVRGLVAGLDLLEEQA